MEPWKFYLLARVQRVSEELKDYTIICKLPLEPRTAHCTSSVQWANELSHQICLEVIVEMFASKPIGEGSSS